MSSESERADRIARDSWALARERDEMRDNWLAERDRTAVLYKLVVEACRAIVRDVSYPTQAQHDYDRLTAALAVAMGHAAEGERD